MTKSPGEIYKTTDGGESWQMQLNHPTVVWRCLGFADSLRGWAGSIGPNCFSPPGTEDTVLFQTTDGGTTWSAVQNIPEPRPDGLCGIWVVNESIVYATGRICGPPRFIKSTDGGATRSTTDMSPYLDRLVDAYFFGPDSGFVVGGLGPLSTTSKGVVLFTSDGGATWNPQYVTNSVGHWGWKLSFPSRQVGYVSLEIFNSGITSYFLKTTDGGINWEEKLLVGGYREQGIGFATNSLGWAGGSLTTYETTDGGDSWHLNNFGVNINRFRMLSDTLGYAIGRRVYKYSRQSTSGVASDDTNVPSEYRLEQNYPNPFNPGTTIQFSLPRSGYVTLEIYNTLGQVMVTLVDGDLPAGVHKVQWNGSGTSSGIYFYRLRAGTFTETKKLLLLK